MHAKKISTLALIEGRQGGGESTDHSLGNTSVVYYRCTGYWMTTIAIGRLDREVSKERLFVISVITDKKVQSHDAKTVHMTKCTGEMWSMSAPWRNVVHI